MRSTLPESCEVTPNEDPWPFQPIAYLNINEACGDESACCAPRTSTAWSLPSTS